MADVIALGSGHEHHTSARLVDRLPRCADTLDRERQVVERLLRISGAVLDRESRDTGRHAACDAVGHLVRLNAVARRKIGTDRHVYRRDEREL